MVAPTAIDKQTKTNRRRIRTPAGIGVWIGRDLARGANVASSKKEEGPKPKWPGPCEARWKITLLMSVSLFLQAFNAQVWPHPPPLPVHAELQKRLAIGR